MQVSSIKREIHSCQMLRERTTVLEQHGHRGLAAVDEGTKYTFKCAWLLKRIIFLSIFTFEHILCLLFSLIYPAVHLLNKVLCELSVRRYNT